MNHLVTEILTTMELEEITDSDYITHDDQKTLTELLRQRLSLNVETLHGHMERQWNSVYWNSDNIRPDRIVHLLNDELKQLQNKTLLTHQNQTSIHDKQQQKEIAQGHAHDSYDNLENYSGGNRSKIDRLNDRAGSNSTGQKRVDHKSDDKSESNSYGESTSNNRYRDRSYSESGGGSFGIDGFGFGISSGSSNTLIDSDSSSRSNYGANDWRNAMSKYSDRSHDESHAWKDTQGTGDDLSWYNETAWRRAANKDRQKAHDHTKTEEDTQSFQELRHKNFDFYTNNRQFIEFTGEKFIVKPVKAYKLNLATFQENTKFVHSSIVVSHMDLIHAVPIRILSSSDALLTTVPVTDNYTNVFESKLHEMNEKLTLNELTIAHMKMLATTIQNNIEKFNEKFNTTEHELIQLKSVATITTNNVEKLNTELKSSITTVDNKFSTLLTTQTEEIKLLLNTSDLTSFHPEIGTIVLFTGFDGLPTTSKWLHCNGSQVSRQTWSKLFSIIGTKYGSGDGLSTFHLPDFRNRFPRGSNGPSKLGSVGGAENHKLTVDELPSHKHEIPSITTSMDGYHSHSYDDPGHYHKHTEYELLTPITSYGVVSGNSYHEHSTERNTTQSLTNILINKDGLHTHTVSGQTASIGIGKQFSILPPFQAVNYIIYAD
jgi:microcystin-dependent protein